MNNSFIRMGPDEPTEDLRKVKLKELEGTNVRIIQAIEDIQRTAAWSSLKETVLDGLVERIEKSIFDEATRPAPDPLKLTRLSGELSWARRFADLTGYANEKRSELLAIKKQLYGKTEH